MFQSIGDYLFMFFFVNLFAALLVAGFAGDRKIGYLPVFFITLFLSPLVGLIAMLTSPTLKDLALQAKRHEELKQTKGTGPSRVEDLERLIRLRDAGELTLEEFGKMKANLM
jgi:hypothetical protein